MVSTDQNSFSYNSRTAQMSDYKDNNNDDVDVDDGSEMEAEQQQEEEEEEQQHGNISNGEEHALSSSSIAPPATRGARKRNKKRNVNTSAASVNSMDSTSHPHVAATMAMTRAETRVVNRWKLLLIFVLLISMIGVGLAVYFFTAKSEQEDFQLQFAQDAHKVLDAVGGSLELTLKAIDALAVSMVVRNSKFKNKAAGTNTTACPY
jgi:hypothetical protein